MALVTWAMEPWGHGKSKHFLELDYEEVLTYSMAHVTWAMEKVSNMGHGKVNTSS